MSTTVSSILEAASGSTSRVQAEAAIAPKLISLRTELETMTFDGPARLLAYSPPTVTLGGQPDTTAARFRFRLNDLHCARKLGNPADVRRVIDDTLEEIRAAALGRFAS